MWYRFQRQRFFVDPAVQGALVRRTIAYACLATLVIATLLVAGRSLAARLALFGVEVPVGLEVVAPVCLALAILLPIVVVDVVHFSNRFVGPLVRVRGHLRRLAIGETAAPIVVRENDYWREFADEFNALSTRYQQLESERRAAILSADRSSGRAWVYADPETLADGISIPDTAAR